MVSQPLRGRRIVVTRAAAQAGEMLDRLRALGAEAVALPTIFIAPPGNPQALAAALAELDDYDGLVFTSANAVAAVAAQVGERRHPRGWVCAAGPATAAALRARLGWEADIVATVFGAEGVVAALAGRPLEGKRILFPRAAAASAVVTEGLTRRGARVTSVEAYRTELPATAADTLAKVLPDADAVVFTSPSTVRNLAGLLDEEGRARLAGRQSTVALVAMGPTTRAALTELDWPVAATAAEATTAGVIAALVKLFHA